MLDYNTGASEQINLKDTVIIDPYPSPISQRTSMHNVPYALNYIDDNNLAQIDTLEQRCRRLYSHNISEAAYWCRSIMSYIEDVSGGVLSYDARIFIQDWNKVQNPYIYYLSAMPEKETLYQLLHIADSPKEPVW